jgi:hypothetical protein
VGQNADGITAAMASEGWNREDNEEATRIDLRLQAYHSTKIDPKDLQRTKRARSRFRRRWRTAHALKQTRRW